MQDIINEDGSVEVGFDESFLHANFDNFNEKYFSNKLKEIPIHWWNKEHSTFQYSIKIREIIPNKIFVSNNVKSFSEFRNVLVHEMLHYYVDCFIIKPTNEQWVTFLKSCIKKGKASQTDMRKLMGEPHGILWLSYAKKLNSKYKELNITAYQRDTKYESSKSKKLHLLLEEQGRKKHYFCLSELRFKNLLKTLSKKGKSSWYELKVNHDNLAYNLKETPEGSRFKREYINYLKSIGALSGELKYLGSKD